ncbi:50S ribosomal protein L11 methyltransferase [Desulfobulbus oligotrophicus]|uniref:Ribosomal protein L11 methyltransferase n=1 Tax=Desulfobulbus oligotrophicus TaxID=1909699 RepID=A0A7T6APN9_9BACT|nr:50S ribosomal protein L11 methyltransferase [Desulfobulbus oligotrophicus]QQG64853.1 50S ribosomal protein L11 methyltransferase [Desulfobulbus oligotrophicus]
MHPTDNPPTATRWLQVSLLCPLLLIDPATDLLGILSGSGVEQSPETEAGATISGFFQLTATDNGQELEEAVKSIRTLVEDEMTALFSLYGLIPNQMHLTVLADQDWATSWQQYFKPFAVIPGLVIKPSWEDYQPEPDESVIEMDPGMAFGTGQHASTCMALDLLKNSMEAIRPWSVLDVGTGTGILAMAVALFGAGNIIAIDNDLEAVTVAKNNVAHNRLSAAITVNSTSLERISGPFQLICANIIHDVLVSMAEQFTRLTEPGAHLVLAGLLSGEQEDSIKAVYSALGWQLLDHRHRDEWAALQLVRLEKP